MTNSAKSMKFGNWIDLWNVVPMKNIAKHVLAVSALIVHLSGAAQSSMPKAATPKSCIGMKRSWDPYPGWWEKRHEEKLAQIAASGGEIDLVFVGDSITHNREGAYVY